MKRKTETFFDAITLLREDLVEEAQNYVFRKKRTGWRTFGSLAACLMLVISLGLLVMPKGCGGAAPPLMNSSGDSCAPAEMPGDSNTAPPSDSDGTGGASTDTAPRPPEGEEAPEGGDVPDFGQGGTLCFTARVLEVLEDGLLVEPFDSLPEGLEQIYVPTAGLESLPKFYPGGVVTVSYETVSLSDGEAVAQGVTEVELLEPEEP